MNSATTGHDAVVASRSQPNTRGGFLRRQGHPLTGVGVGLFFTMGGMIFACLAAATGLQTLRFSFGTAEVGGRVVAWHTSTGGKGGTIWHPVVRYGVDGREFTVTARSGASFQDYALGDPVGVLYRKTQPHEAQVNSVSERWTGLLVPGALGLLCIAMGGMMAWKSFQEWRRTSPLAGN